MGRMSAVISPCGTYRYRLYRDVSPIVGSGQLLWMMLNPSTADAEQDDPTIRKCIGFTKRLGFSRLAVGNLFAYRATDPKALAKFNGDIVGPDNIAHICAMRDESQAVMFAWGTHGARWPGTVKATLQLFDAHPHVRQMRLGDGMNGQPYHPLMIPYDAVVRLKESV